MTYKNTIVVKNKKTDEYENVSASILIAACIIFVGQIISGFIMMPVNRSNPTLEYYSSIKIKEGLIISSCYNSKGKWDNLYNRCEFN